MDYSASPPPHNLTLQWHKPLREAYLAYRCNFKAIESIFRGKQDTTCHFLKSFRASEVKNIHRLLYVGKRLHNKPFPVWFLQIEFKHAKKNVD